jgi:hypothetical protein
VRGNNVRRKKAVQGRSYFQGKIARIREAGARPERSQKNRRARSLVAPLQRKSLIYGLALPLLITLIIGALVYKAYETWPNLFVGTRDVISSTSPNLGAGVLAVTPRVEALRYYLEIAPSNNATRNEATQATGLAGLAGGTNFKFHFKPIQSGYFYIIAFGRNGAPQTFLTAQPMPASGVTSNRSEAGGDFSFPDGGQWFMIQKDADVTPFTVIFSKTPLKTPAFLSSPSGRELSDSERQELAELKKRHAANNPDLVSTKDGNQPVVLVQAPGEPAANEPIIFDVSIKRQ